MNQYWQIAFKYIFYLLKKVKESPENLGIEILGI